MKEAEKRPKERMKIKHESLQILSSFEIMEEPILLRMPLLPYGSEYRREARTRLRRRHAEKQPKLGGR
jgi:hypothetical protein